MITLKGQLCFLFKLIGDLSMLFLVEMYSCIMVVMRCAHLKLQQIFHFFLNFLIFFNFPLTFKLKKKNHTNHLQQPQHITLDLFNGTTVLGNANCTDP